MKYLMLIYMTENAMTDAEREQCYKDSTQLCHDLQTNDQFLGANPLQPVAAATSVRIREGKRMVTDGPFAETREQLGGYFLVNAQDLDSAIAIASRIPAAKRGTVEIRPVLEIHGIPVAG
ncbi:MAG TPA: YciI family protein [Tepidisphaeraceae bacterium]|nr:YciI family protein [Tepidisphaeraceae bacterium]